MADLDETNALLTRILASLDRGRLGLIDDPPGRRTIFANRVRAPDGCCWYFWDPDTQSPTPIDETALRGRLTDLVVYEKSSPEGATVKLRVTLACGWAQYDVETSLYATSGTGLLSGLTEARAALAEGPITIGVRRADKEEVLFLDVYTDEGGLQIHDDPIVAGDETRALKAAKRVRTALGLDPDPWTDRFDPPAGGAGRTPEEGSGGAPPGATANRAPPRGEHPDEDDGVKRSKFSGRRAPAENETVEIEGLPEQTAARVAELPVHVQEGIKVRHQELQKRSGEALEEAVEQWEEEMADWPDQFREVGMEVLDHHGPRTFEPNDELPF